MGSPHYSLQWCTKHGFNDSLPCLIALDKWRQAWRPKKKVRILLVAESHVREEKGDLRVRVSQPRGAYEPLPRRFVRLIYCLGYGENSLCTPKKYLKKYLKSNKGTPQFWKLFQVIVECNKDAKPPQEISQKLRTLRKLQKRGVWLLDASIGALAKSGKTRKDRRVKIRKYRSTIRDSFKKFVWPMVQRDRPKQVWAIGRGVGKALATLHLVGMPEISDRWIISQPNGQNEAQCRKDLAKLVRGISVCKKRKPSCLKYR
jgi:hypothetical protein